ncbi:MAG: glycosyltransferase involved in cell wall biosynthesis, partial [Pirellulaceae bacterium]
MISSPLQLSNSTRNQIPSFWLAMLSIVIPVFNEDESLDELHRQIISVANAKGYELDIIFIDDGSTDDSWKVIERLSSQHREVSGLRFRRNFGKAAALSAGFKAARGDLVFTMDADLQDDPEEMPRFLEKMETECDVVSGYKQRRLDPWHKVYPSRIFNWLVSYLTGVKLHDHNCGFKCYRREIFDEVRLYGELHRFVPVLAASRGWRVGEVVVNHRPRQFGYSKYGFRRFVKGFLDLLTVYFLTGFKQRPQHLLGTLGVIAFLMGLAGLMYLAVYWIVAQIFPTAGLMPLHERPAVIYSMGTLLLGAQLMSMGFLAELMTAYYGESEKTYSISQKTSLSTSEASDGPIKKATPPVPHSTIAESPGNSPNESSFAADETADVGSAFAADETADVGSAFAADETVNNDEVNNGSELEPRN